MSGDQELPERDRKVEKRLRADAFRAEEQEPEADQRQMDTEGGDQKHEDRCFRERRKYQPIDDQPEWDENCGCERDLDDDPEPKRGNKLRDCDQKEGQGEIQYRHTCE